MLSTFHAILLPEKSNQGTDEFKFVLKWPFGVLRPLVCLFVTSVVTSVGSAHQGRPYLEHLQPAAA